MWGVTGRASELGGRREPSRREKAEGSRSFTGDGKRNRGGPRWIERVEIDAKDGDESERASGGGGGDGGNGRHERREGRDFTYLHSHQNAEVRARRDGLM